MTLPELLTVVTIGAILLSAASVSFDAVVNNSRQATGVNQLVSTLHAARSEAITRNVQVTICPTTDGATCDGAGNWHSGWLYFADVDRSRTPGGGNVSLGQGAGMDNLTIQSGEFASFLVYRPNGRIMVDSLDENTGEFTLCDHRGASHARVILIDTAGEPHLSETLADGSTPVCPEG